MSHAHQFRAMGSDAEVIVVGEPSLIDRAVARVADLEARWSRFVDDSEVSRLNRCAGERVAVSPDTVNLVRHAIEAWRLSGGSVDPTVLGDVLRAGYDRPFDQLRTRAPRPVSLLVRGVTAIEVDDGGVRLPDGVGFDPGGIGKGLAADLVTCDLLAAGADGVCVNLGGDLRVAGEAPDGGAWTVAVEHPEWREPIAHLGLLDGAIATSTTLLRRWDDGDGRSRHHLIDPATGLPSNSDLAFVTVVADTAWRAEGLAKAVLLRRSDHPFDILGGTGAAALAVTDDGRVLASPGVAAFTGGSVP
jgi:thiamine biosynthesis lipoprotein